MRDSDDIYDNQDEVDEIVSRYEAAKLSGASVYFDVDEFLMIIDYYMINDRSNEAVEACNLAMKLHGNDPELVLIKARIDLARGDYKKALKSILPIEEVMSDNCDYYLTKAALIVSINNKENVMDLLKKALDLTEDDTPESRADMYIDIGEILEHAQQYDRAIKFYKMATAEYPENIDFVFKIGICYEYLGESEKSIGFYNKAIDIDPFSDYAWYNIGIAYNRMGDFEKAIEAYNYAIALNPDFSDAVFNKGNTCCNARKYKEALECYQEYLRIYPDSVSAQCYIGECYVQLGRIDEAEAVYDKMLQKNDTSNVDAWYGKAMVCNARNEPEKGIEALKRLLDIDNEHDSAWFHLGRFYFLLDQHEEALIAFKKSLNLNKYNALAWQNESLILLLQNRYEQASEELQNALELYLPDDPILLYTLAGAQFLSGDDAECIRNFKKAYNIDSEMKDYFLSLVPKTKLPAEIKKLCNLNSRRGRKKNKDNNNIDNNEQQ